MDRYPINKFTHLFSSQIRPIKIYLPKIKAKDEDADDNNFIGRKLLMDKLYNWIQDKDPKGSFLVTGFRGMGKTSMVDRVLNRLTKKIKDGKELCGYISILLLLACIYVIVLPNICEYIQQLFSNDLLGVILFVISIFFAVITVFPKTNFWNSWKILLYPKRIKGHFTWNNVKKMVVGDGVDKEKASFKNIVIKVNLGHEVLKERDVLSVVASSIREKYKRFFRSVQAHFWVYYLISALSGIIACLIITFFRIPAEKLLTYGKYFQLSQEGDWLTINVINDSWFAREFYNVSKIIQQFLSVNGILSTAILFIILTLLAWVLLRWLLSILPYTSVPFRALKKLNVLSERIIASTDEEKGSAASFDKSGVSISLFGGRKKKSFPKADIREIEQNLSSIINMLNVKHHPFRAKFIVVFDEMDKIDPESSYVANKADIPEYTDSVNGFPDGLDSRGRRQNVLRLLANMKLFLSTADAKFIFISGRELYDAYLADLSDRDYSISSIFSGVLNVDSFLTPEEDQSDVKSMAEWYIAKQLLPDNYLKNVERRNARENEVLKPERPSLKWYYQYLFEHINGEDDNAEERRRDVIYVIMFLHIYAAYLTHISNGSPKKMFLYFSKYKRKNKDVEQLNDWGDVCEVGVYEGEEQDVLWFDPIQQKTINFVHYLTDSFMQTITNDYSKFGDRFLVSLTFIIDHLYKHHNRAFSWRNLEQIPDLFKTNRAPELRNSLASIMEYLTQMHIAKIPIGLNEFKFKQSISEEISLMSKMSDEASALFNFTLDESSSVIQHNTRILQYYMNLAKSDPNSNGRYDAVLARIHANLGDLHFWDEDYYNAALEYRNAIQLLKNKTPDEDIKSFLSVVRCSLKMGLTYESRKLYLNAYQNYCNLVDFLIDKRWIEEGKLGLDIIDERVADWRGKRRVLVYEQDESQDNGDERQRTFNEQFGHTQYRRGNGNFDYSVNVDGMLSSFAKDLTKEKSKNIAKLTLFEEVRYLYQVILAKLSIVEKMGISGITQTNIDVAEGEFNILHKSVNIKEKFMISADFFRKLAELLYYKNSLTLSSQDQNSLYSTLYYDEIDLLSNIDDFCRDSHGDAVQIKDVLKRFFFNLTDLNVMLNANDIKQLYAEISKSPELNKYNANDRDVIQGYCNRSINEYLAEKVPTHNFANALNCAHHRATMRQEGLRTPCLACKYYNRSIRILTENLFGKEAYLTRFNTNDIVSKAVEILRCSFKNQLIYASSVHIDMFAKSVEGMGNIMLSCASDEKDERFILSENVVALINDLCDDNEEQSHQIIDNFHPAHLTRLDKCLLYYLDAYRIYLMVNYYDSAIGCLNKIITTLYHYIRAIRLRANEYSRDADAVRIIVGNDDAELNSCLIGKLYSLIVRYTAFKYDFSNHSELRELRWIYCRQSYRDIDLMFLSLYSDVRSALLKSIQIIADGIRYIDRVDNNNEYSERYISHISQTYNLIAPSRRFETTSYNDVYGLFAKACYNEHVMNCLLGGNVMTTELNYHDNNVGYYGPFKVVFYEKLAEFLSSNSRNGLHTSLFGIDETILDRLDLIEYIICDSLVCLSNITRLVSQHNHLTMYSSAFVGLVHNYMWEWSQKYESLLLLFRYQEINKENERQEEASQLLDSVLTTLANDEYRQRFIDAIERCRNIVTSINNIEDENIGHGDRQHQYGLRSDMLYARLRRYIDDVTINTIFSNYTAESAINYFKMADEENTEGDAYKDMINAMHFLDDDFNNDTSQFNLACERFLLNFGIVRTQRERLDHLYRPSRVYRLSSWLNSEGNFYSQVLADENQFENSIYTNSEY